MKVRLLGGLFVFLALFGLSSCSKEDRSTPDYNPMVGPFDEDGNYVEAWADNPPKKSRFARKSPEPAPEPKPERVLQSRPVMTPEPERQIVSRAPMSSPSQPVSRPKPVAQPQPKPKPKVAAKPKPKPKPKPSFRSHSVVKGDTLYSLGRRYGTSVAAIQKANGLSGTNIRIGQKLKIP